MNRSVVMLAPALLIFSVHAVEIVNPIPHKEDTHIAFAFAAYFDELVKNTEPDNFNAIALSIIYPRRISSIKPYKGLPHCRDKCVKKIYKMRFKAAKEFYDFLNREKVKKSEPTYSELIHKFYYFNRSSALCLFQDGGIFAQAAAQLALKELESR